MISINLMSNDILSSVNFYTEFFKMEIEFLVDEKKNIFNKIDQLDSKIAFASLKYGDYKLMLQSSESLENDIAEAAQSKTPILTGTLYFHEFDPREIYQKIPENYILKKPEISWYKMEELYLKDPNGYVICVGKRAN